MVRVRCDEAEGEMYLHGGHVTSWRPAGGEEVLYLSASSNFSRDKAIRGGVPVCFPWFGPKAEDATAPSHGFARLMAWQLRSIVRFAGATTVTMVAVSDESTKELWDGEFRVIHKVRFGASLSMELSVTNTGRQPLRYEEALHSYFRVGDVSAVRVRGLDGSHYLDKADGLRVKQQRGDVTIERETDRVYLDTESAVLIDDPSLGRQIRVAKTHSRATVIWNPWDGAALADLDDWRGLVCVETANVGASAIELLAGEEHTMGAVVGVTT
jgi:glucose-6-phosphate 1-epimerase